MCPILKMRDGGSSKHTEGIGGSVWTACHSFDVGFAREVVGNIGALKAPNRTTDKARSLLITFLDGLAVEAVWRLAGAFKE